MACTLQSYLHNTFRSHVNEFNIPAIRLQIRPDLLNHFLDFFFH